jgi:hypothetical protein
MILFMDKPNDKNLVILHIFKEPFILQYLLKEWTLIRLGLENELALRRKTERTVIKNYDKISSHKRNQFVREQGVSIRVSRHMRVLLRYLVIREEVASHI